VRAGDIIVEGLYDQVHPHFCRRIGIYFCEIVIKQLRICWLSQLLIFRLRFGTAGLPKRLRCCAQLWHCVRVTKMNTNHEARPRANQFRAPGLTTSQMDFISSRRNVIGVVKKTLAPDIVTMLEAGPEIYIGRFRSPSIWVLLTLE
jgi:hypothetical protein